MAQLLTGNTGRALDLLYNFLRLADKVRHTAQSHDDSLYHDDALLGILSDQLESNAEADLETFERDGNFLALREAENKKDIGNISEGCRTLKLIVFGRFGWEESSPLSASWRAATPF